MAPPLTDLFGRLLVLAPHPDDEILGAGGTIHRLLSEGGQVTVCYVAILKDDRLEEIREGLHTLGRAQLPYSGLSYRILLHHDAGERFELLPAYKRIDVLDAVIQELQPGSVMLPCETAHHQDHRFVARAAMAALRPSGASGRYRPPAVLGYELPSDAWGLEPASQGMGLTITLSDDDIGAKCAAMEAHVSQRRDSPSERSRDALLALARLRGLQAGVSYAEVFRVFRHLR